MHRVLVLLSAFALAAIAAAPASAQQVTHHRNTFILDPVVIPAGV
jgi:uncharacterized membrane protein